MKSIFILFFNIVLALGVICMLIPQGSFLAYLCAGLVGIVAGFPLGIAVFNYRKQQCKFGHNWVAVKMMGGVCTRTCERCLKTETLDKSGFWG